MTASYIIWHEKIWVKDIVRAFWQIGLSYVERILKIKIHSCNDLSQNLIGSIIIYKILLVKNQIEYCRNVFVGLVDISLDWRNRGNPDKINEQDKRLSKPSSFHCCHLQDLFHVLVVSVLIVLCVLQCAPGWDLLCQRNSVERELSIKGWLASPLSTLSLQFSQWVRSAIWGEHGCYAINHYTPGGH